MPQGPLNVRDVIDNTTAYYNLTAATALRTTGGGRVASVSVITAGTVGGVFDASATGSPATVGRQIAVIPATVGVYAINWLCATGIVIAPGTSQTLSISLA